MERSPSMLTPPSYLVEPPEIVATRLYCCLGLWWEPLTSDPGNRKESQMPTKHSSTGDSMLVSLQNGQEIQMTPTIAIPPFIPGLKETPPPRESKETPTKQKTRNESADREVSCARNSFLILCKKTTHSKSTGEGPHTVMSWNQGNYEQHFTWRHGVLSILREGVAGLWILFKTHILPLGNCQLPYTWLQVQPDLF